MNKLKEKEKSKNEVMEEGAHCLSHIAIHSLDSDIYCVLLSFMLFDN